MRQIKSHWTLKGSLSGFAIAFLIQSVDRSLFGHLIGISNSSMPSLWQNLKNVARKTRLQGSLSRSLFSRLIVRDLPISGKPTYLRFVRRRFFCDDCHRAFSESLGFVDERRDYTHRCQHWIFLQVRENNISAVHRAEGLTYDQIESIFFHEARCRIPLAPFANLKRSTERIASRIYYRPRCSLS